MKKSVYFVLAALAIVAVIYFAAKKKGQTIGQYIGGLFKPTTEPAVPEENNSSL